MNAGPVSGPILPYMTLAILIVGCWWRYRYDRFGWTTRSSQLYESQLLRIGSPLFHFGILIRLPRPRHRTPHPPILDRRLGLPARLPLGLVDSPVSLASAPWPAPPF